MVKVTIILSSPRSGSSWLSRVVRCVPDHSVFTHNTFTTQFLYSLYPLRSANPWADDSVRSSSLDRWRVHRLRSHIESRSGSNPIVLISPTLSNFLPILSRAFPEAQYVHFQRNPFDTIASMKKFMAKNDCGFWDRYREHAYGGRLFATRGALVHTLHRLRWMRLIHRGYLGLRPGGFQSVRKADLLEFLTWYYCANQRDVVNGLGNVPGDRQMEMHYEKLVDGFDDESSRLLRFMTGGDDKFDIPRPHDGVKSGTVGRRNELFNAAEMATIRDYLLASAPRQVLEPYGIVADGSSAGEELVRQSVQ